MYLAKLLSISEKCKIIPLKMFKWLYISTINHAQSTVWHLTVQSSVFNHHADCDLFLTWRCQISYLQPAPLDSQRWSSRRAVDSGVVACSRDYPLSWKPSWTIKKKTAPVWCRSPWLSGWAVANLLLIFTSSRVYQRGLPENSNTIMYTWVHSPKKSLWIHLHFKSILKPK